MPDAVVSGGIGLALKRMVYRRLAKSRRTRWIVRNHWAPFRLQVEGLWFDLQPADNTTEHEMFLTGRLPEPTSIHTLIELVRGRRCLIADIGANCGAFTLALARAAGPGSRVLAFEPNPAMADRLQTNLALNDLGGVVTVHRVALSDAPGTMTLNLHKRNFGQSSLLPVPNSRPIEVPVHRLSDYLTDRGDAQLVLIKIDVEGNEDRVLVPFLASADNGALPDAILIEVVASKDWAADLPAALKRAGYTGGPRVEGNVLYRRTEAAYVS